MSTEQEFRKLLKEEVKVYREDIARAKQFILIDPHSETDGIVNRWLQANKMKPPTSIVHPSPNLTETITQAARVYSLRMAVYRAVRELIAAGEVIPLAPAKEWVPEITYRIHNMQSGMRIEALKTYFVPEIGRLDPADDDPTDPDIFLRSIDCAKLDSGIREAVDQSLICFRRGLYLPATAMLTAAVEGAWTECGRAVAKNLGNAKFEAVVNEPLTGIGKIVADTRKALEDGIAKPLLKKAGQSLSKVDEAVTWTTVLRDRRNALHWSKAQGFVADHSGTAALLMGAPQHIGTLEAIRTAC